jgi:hypothetical protein
MVARPPSGPTLPAEPSRTVNGSAEFAPDERDRETRTMGVLSDFERRLEGAVEGFFARAFRSGVQPVELAKALQRYMGDTRHVAEDGVVVPNVFRFRLNPKDIDRLSTYGDKLRQELGEVALRTSKERGWMLRGPALVRLESSDEVNFGTYILNGRVEAVDRDATGAVTSAVRRGEPSARLRVVRGGEPGAEYPLQGPRVVAGRSSDCDVPLDDSTVSRRHAAFVLRGDDWWVVDLESTNGTRVNGSDTVEQRLRRGDRVELGEAVLEFAEASG